MEARFGIAPGRAFCFAARLAARAARKDRANGSTRTTGQEVIALTREAQEIRRHQKGRRYVEHPKGCVLMRDLSRMLDGMIAFNERSNGMAKRGIIASPNTNPLKGSAKGGMKVKPAKGLK